MSIMEWFRWYLIGKGFNALAVALKRMSNRDRMLCRALEEFDGVYRIESGDGKFCWHLVFEGGGKVGVYKEWPDEVDFTFTLYRPSEVSLRVKPENLLEVIIGNKIGQSGNMHYLYQFGFVMSLLENSIRRKKKAKRQKDERAEKA